MTPRAHALVRFLTIALALGLGIGIGANIPELHSDSCKTAVRSTDAMLVEIRTTVKTMFTASEADKKANAAAGERALQNYTSNRDACLGGR